ncbi:MAG: hypothetical protein GXP30_14295 [Verrucomicrobia bacterium]|nr:hypothetical protein [Verrucomicrobiota bacterium]
MKTVLLILSLLFALLIAGIACGLYYLKTRIEKDPQGVITQMWDFAMDDETKQLIVSNETAVTDALRDYVKAQTIYKSNNGHYARTLSDLELPAEMKLADMDAFTSGDNKSFNGKGYKGYTFAHVPKNGTQGMNYEKDFVLCAFPALYHMTGLHTYAIGPKGIVLQSNNNGLPVHNATEFTNGSWITPPEFRLAPLPDNYRK